MEEVYIVSIPANLWPRRTDWKAKVIKIYVSEGDVVKKGDPLIDIELEKAILTIEAEVDGKVEDILVSEGDEVGPGEEVLVIGK